MTHAEARQRHKEMANAVKSGQSMGQVAKKYGVTISTVTTACVMYGSIRRMTHKAKIARRARMAAMVKAGKSIAFVTKHFGVSACLVYLACKEAGMALSDNYHRKPTSAFLILKRLLDGEKQRAIADKLNLSIQRVSAVAVAAREAGFKV